MNTDPNHGAFAAFDREDYQMGLTKREIFFKDILVALLANPARYEYISEKVASSELTQDAANNKNVMKALYLTDAAFKALNYSYPICRLCGYAIYRPEDGKDNHNICAAVEVADRG